MDFKFENLEVWKLAMDYLDDVIVGGSPEGGNVQSSESMDPGRDIGWVEYRGRIHRTNQLGAGTISWLRNSVACGIDGMLPDRSTKEISSRGKWKVRRPDTHTDKEATILSKNDSGEGKRILNITGHHPWSMGPSSMYNPFVTQSKERGMHLEYRSAIVHGLSSIVCILGQRIT